MKRMRGLPLHILLVALSLVMAYPVLVMVFTAFKSNAEVYQNPIGPPRRFTVENFISSWRVGGFEALFANSLFLTITSMTLGTLCASLAAYGSVRRGGRLGSAVYLVLAAGIFLPMQLAIIPQFRVLTDLGLVNTYSGVILLFVAGTMPFGMFLIASFMRQIPVEILEAATIDGASYFRMYLSIFLPLARPAIVTFWILQGVGIWNEYLVPLLVLSDPDKRTLTTGILAFRQEYVADWGNIMAGVVIISAPVVIAFLLLQKYFVNGLYAGAVK